MPAGYGHDELKKSEEEAGPDYVKNFQALHGNACSHRNRESIHGKTEADKDNGEYCHLVPDEDAAAFPSE